MGAIEDARGVEEWWTSWGRLTRFFHSTNIALNSERDELGRKAIENRDETKVVVSTGTGGEYTVTVAEHEAALSDRGDLWSIMVVTSYSQVEKLGRLVSRAMGLGGDDEDERDLGKIEVWGTALVTKLGSSWESVPKGGLAGLVEVNVVRNSLVHGIGRVNARMLNRVHDAEGDLPWANGEAIDLNIELVAEYRARLKSFARVIGGEVAVKAILAAGRKG